MKGAHESATRTIETDFMTAVPQQFLLDIPDADVVDLNARLERTRLPDQAPGAPWAFGTDRTYMRSLAEYWRTAFD